jgi:flagellar hook-length control protein FliK
MAETLSPEESPAPKTADARAAAPAVAAASTDASAADYASEAAIVAPRGEASAVARRADEPSRVMARDAWRSALAASATGSSAESRTTDSPPTSPALATVTNTAPVGDAGVAQPAPPTAHIATAAHTLPTVAHAGAPTAAADHVLDQGPVDTTAPRWQDAFANRVQWLANQSVGEANIRLNPPDLGTVDVKISLVEDRTFVQLTTHTNAARDELAQSLPRLRELFATSGLELGGASVSTGRDGQARYDGAAADQPQAQRQAFASVGDVPAIAAAPRRALTAASRIDLFA